MTIGRLRRAWSSRVAVLRAYARCAPDWSSLPAWLRLGAIRARLFGGEARLAPRSFGERRDLAVRIGGRSDETVIVDLTSDAELEAFDEIFAKRVYPVERVALQPGTIIDCGANVGYFAALCRTRWPKARIVCFEPERANFSRLARQPILQSGLIECIETAASVLDGEVAFCGDGIGGAIAGPGTAAVRRVNAISLGRWLRENCQNAALIKIDIEGHEEELMPSLTTAWPKPCALFLETHAQDGGDARLLSVLGDAGFSSELLRTHRLPRDPRVFKEYLLAKYA
jgi:FkbM family methyltransferase